MQSALAVDTATDLFSLFNPVYGTNERARGSFRATRISNRPCAIPPWSDKRREKGTASLPVVVSPRAMRAAVKKTVAVSSPPVLGIDLAKRGVEVRKLFYAAFARGLAKDGYDPEEALQEVYRGLLARNAGSCPFDSRKSSFGHYVHIVTRCVLANYIRKERRRGSFESNESSLSAAWTEESGRTFSIESMADTRTSRVPDGASILNLARAIGGGDLGVKAIQLLAAGHSRKEVLGQLRVEPKWLDSLLTSARAQLSA